MKIGAKVIAHGRYAIVHMAEVAVPRELFAASWSGSQGYVRQTQPMLTLEGCSGRQPGVELRPECVLEVPQSGSRRGGQPSSMRLDVAGCLVGGAWRLRKAGLGGSFVGRGTPSPRSR